MNHKLARMLLVVLGALLLLGVTVALAQGPASRPQAAPDPSSAAPLDLTPTAVITVTSSSDDGGQSERCETYSPCTLRRAVNEVRFYQYDAETYLIAFDLDTNDPGYDPDSEVWVFDVESDNSGSDIFAYRDFGTHGQVIIDGTTQAIGRDLADGPRIILRGDNHKGAFTLTGGNNVIRGLAFQGFGDRMVSVPGTSANLVEDNWFGLTITGTGIYLRNPSSPESGSGESGVYVQSGGTTNTIQGNVLVGFYGGAINLDSDNSFVLSNTVGTFYDGTVPQVRADRKCKPNARYYNWFAGAGVDVFGTNNLIAYNRIVGMLFMSADPDNTPDDALEVTGHDHVIRDNIIGLTSDGQPFGVCGEGIHIGGVSGAFDIQVLDNRVVGSRGEVAILTTGGPLGYDLDSVTLQGNIIEDSANEAVDFGTMVPSELRLFKSAAVTSIVGTSVSGTSGQDSPCEGCIIELFLDEIDTVNETLESLAVVTADGSGNWSATLPRTLAITEGIRTASTSVVDGQIPHPDEPSQEYRAGMTAKPSELYVQDGAPEPTPPAPAEPLLPLPIPPIVYLPPPGPPAAYTTTITVTSAADPDDSKAYTCYTDFDGPGEPAPDGVCTLRRAIIEATKAVEEDPNARPVQIQFDIPTSDPQYDDSAGVWVIQLTETLETNALPTLGSTNVEKSGQVVIDGYSQPDHDVLRPDDPRIIVRSPLKTPAGYALVVNGEGNVIQGLAFQGFRMYLQINHSGSIIRDNWLGLTVDGQDIYLRDQDSPESGSGLSGITIADNTSNHLIQDNRLAGMYGGAIDVQGDDSYILGNYVGTRADGTIPGVAASRYCKPNARYYAWFGGAGIDVSGSRNQVGGPSAAERNVIAGLLFMSADPLNTPDTAIDIYGKDHLIQNNYVGLDVNGLEVGTCGRGIVIDASFTRILSNTLYGVGIEAFRSSGSYATSNARFFQGNIVQESKALLEYGNAIPQALSIFTPTQVITIDGTTVSGGDGHPLAHCPYCQVELFLDNLDEVSETLESMLVITTDVNGNWTATLPRVLTMDEGLRTVSTALNYGVIQDHEAGTSSRFSDVYSQTGSIPPLPPTPADPEPPLPIPEPTYLDQPEPPAAYNTTIIVTSAADPDDSKTYTCDTDFGGGAEPAPDGVCTLRRAIIEATKAVEADPNARPVQIQFNIPTGDPQYDDSAGVWIIQLTETLELNALPTLGSTNVAKSGQVVIDGYSQPDHDVLRSDAPRIIVRSPLKTPAGAALVVNGEGNVIQGLAFQGFRMYLQINHSGSIIRDNWLGLTVDGQDIYLRDQASPEIGSGQSGIMIADNTSNHLVQDNRLAGFYGGAIDVQGDDSYILGNYVGTRADGTVPEVAANRYCKPNARYYNWFGGAGIDVSGSRNQVGGPSAAERNVIAGLLFMSADPENTPDTALDLYGQDHLVQNNYVGLDVNGLEVGTCGRGIVIDSSFTRILSNSLYGVGIEALRSSGTYATSNARFFQGNVVKESTALLEYGNGIPEALSIFTPTQVITIDGTTVSGGDGHPLAHCPYCQVELFLDNLDEVPETLEPLVVTSADVNGDWTTTLPRALSLDEGLRTVSTMLDYGIIENYEAGTSSRFSDVFGQPGSVPPTPPTPPDPGQPLSIPEPSYLAAPEPPMSYTTVVTVTTASDSDTSSTKTCDDVAADACSLRLAINHVKTLPASQRPALIAFDIPTGDAGYDPAGFWKITLSSTALPPVKGGQVSMDGSTQPGGRSDAPKIILFRDSTTGAKLRMGETQFEGSHVVQGLALQGVELSLTGNDNIIQDNWLGLSDDGASMYFYNDDPGYENHAIIIVYSSGDHNLLQNNRLAGSKTKAIDLKGSDDNIVRGNYVGLLADGTIDVASVNFDNLCQQTIETDNWFGGGGISVIGKRNQVISNTIAGLLIPGSANSTPPDAIELPSGQDSLVQYNRIGQDATGADMWTCGSGMDIGSGYTRVYTNTIVSSFKEGLFINGTVMAINANQLRGNVISDCVQAIEFGAAVPEELALFKPALVTVISDTNISGISDDYCPFCWVDVYLDDDDGFEDARAYLGSAIANVNGHWSLELTVPLTEGQGLRTISTARDYGAIEKFEAGTSSRLSTLFTAQPLAGPSSVLISGPDKGLPGIEYSFTANVSPLTATLPITYVWQATEQLSQTVSGGAEKTVSFSWDSLGQKTVTVTVGNGYGSSVEDVYTITIGEESDFYIYLPVVLRASN